MMKYINSEFLITEFYNIPFRTIFRFGGNWCTKFDVNSYKLIIKLAFEPNKYAISNNYKYAIASNELVVTHASSVPKYLREYGA